MQSVTTPAGDLALREATDRLIGPTQPFTGDTTAWTRIRLPEAKARGRFTARPFSGSWSERNQHEPIQRRDKTWR